VWEIPDKMRIFLIDLCEKFKIVPILALVNKKTKIHVLMVGQSLFNKTKGIIFCAVRNNTIVWVFRGIIVGMAQLCVGAALNLINSVKRIRKDMLFWELILCVSRLNNPKTKIRDLILWIK
jgi:hypothetical protein